MKKGVKDVKVEPSNIGIVWICAIYFQLYPAIIWVNDVKTENRRPMFLKFGGGWGGSVQKTKMVMAFLAFGTFQDWRESKSSNCLNIQYMFCS